MSNISKIYNTEIPEEGRFKKTDVISPVFGRIQEKNKIDYPKVEKEFIFTDIANVVDNKIEFIKNFRNIKAENNIPKDAKVLIKNDTINKVFLNMKDMLEELSKDYKKYVKII